MLSAEKFIGNGVYIAIDDPAIFSGKRTLVIDNGRSSIEAAIELSKESPRIVFVTISPEKEFDPDVKKRLREVGAKILYESELLEVMGVKEVEKVRINNKDEDEEYELFIDAVVMLP